jgi:hypothetical protein
MRLAEGCYINNVARLERNEEIERESREVDEEIANTPAEPVSVPEAVETLDDTEADE